MKPWPGIADVEPLPGEGDEGDGGLRMTDLIDRQKLGYIAAQAAGRASTSNSGPRA
ncbi:MAG: hypothetical protein R2713_21085 [Ilumatobacteraceae bacterium]